MSRITVSRKGYTRRAYTARRKGKKVRVGRTVVEPSTYTMHDRGRRGRGPKIVTPLQRGALGGPGFFSRTATQQKKIVFRRAKKLGKRKVVGELRALQVFFKRTDRRKSNRALTLSKQVAGSFRGKHQVGYPKGFRRTR